MAYTVLVPARLASTRLPRKPLADIAGLPMIVRVAQRCRLSQAARVVVATDDTEIRSVCEAHGVEVVMTRADHPTGSDRLAEACSLLGLPDDAVVVNVQGDEPLIEPSVIDACAATLAQHPECVMSTVGHPLTDVADYRNPNVVKLVTDRAGRALYFSRAPIPWWRDGAGMEPPALPAPAPLRHIGLYGYSVGFLKRFPSLEVSPLETVEALEQLRTLWHGERIAVHVTDHQPGAGVDTPEDLERVRRLFTS